MDACKHMWPGDIEAIYSRMQNTVFNGQPFIFNEVIDMGGEAVGAGEYIHLGRVTEFRYSANIGSVFRKWNGQKMSHLRNFGQDWGFLNSNDALAFVDNHDNQRGHGPGGASVLTFKTPKEYKQATAFKLAWTYGFIRIMSSYDFVHSDDGPPSNGDDISDVPINDDGSCDGGWICEHRWRQITNMVGFKNQVGWSDMNNWWDNGENQIAFSRGDQGFIAINGDWYDMDVHIPTSLPDGQYCDVISGSADYGCTGGTITVSGGQAQVYISGGHEDAMIAIHQGK